MIVRRAPSIALSSRSGMQSASVISLVIILTKKSFVGDPLARCFGWSVLSVAAIYPPPRPDDLASSFVLFGRTDPACVFCVHAISDNEQYHKFRLFKGLIYNCMASDWRCVCRTSDFKAQAALSDSVGRMTAAHQRDAPTRAFALPSTPGKPPAEVGGRRRSGFQQIVGTARPLGRPFFLVLPAHPSTPLLWRTTRSRTPSGVRRRHNDDRSGGRSRWLAHHPGSASFSRGICRSILQKPVRRTGRGQPTRTVPRRLDSAAAARVPYFAAQRRVQNNPLGSIASIE